MDVKKKNFLENLRQKVNLKKPRRKPLKEQSRLLAHRRSISVPNLLLLQGEGFADSPLTSTASEAVFRGISPGLSDSDSIASSSIADEINKGSDCVLRAPTDHVIGASNKNRASAPGETFKFYDEEDMTNSVLENKGLWNYDGLYAQVDKRPKSSVPVFSFDPVPAPRSVFNYPQVSSPRPDLAESLDSEYTSIETVVSAPLSAALARASSLGDQVNPHVEKRAVSFEQRKTSSEKGTPPTEKKAPGDRTSLMLDIAGIPTESSDAASVDLPCGTPSEDPVSVPWTTDSEELDQEPFSPLYMREFSMEEVLPEEAPSEEALEDMVEVSPITRWEQSDDPVPVCIVHVLQISLF